MITRFILYLIELCHLPIYVVWDTPSYSAVQLNATSDGGANMKTRFHQKEPYVFGFYLTNNSARRAIDNADARSLSKDYNYDRTQGREIFIHSCHT